MILACPLCYRVENDSQYRFPRYLRKTGKYAESLVESHTCMVVLRESCVWGGWVDERQAVAIDII